MVTEGYHADFEELDVEDREWWERYGAEDEEDDVEDSSFYANFGNFCDWFKTIVANIEQYRESNRKIEEEKKAVDLLITQQRQEILARALADRAQKKKVSQNAVDAANATRVMLEKQQQSAVLPKGVARISSVTFAYLSSDDGKDEGAVDERAGHDAKVTASGTGKAVTYQPRPYLKYSSSDSSDDGEGFGFGAERSSGRSQVSKSTGKHNQMRFLSDASMDTKQDNSSP
jgi:hypothetical protein